LLWCGIKRAENELKTTHVSDRRLSLGENAHFSEMSIFSLFSERKRPFSKSGHGTAPLFYSMIHLTYENFPLFSRSNSCERVINTTFSSPLQVKTAFTRRYNKEGGFLPYSIVQHAKKKAGAASAEVSEFGEEVIFNLLNRVI
jgi:hypothetical protein